MKRWFPIDYEVLDGSRLRKVLSVSSDWQIYGLGHGSRALVVKLGLFRRWTEIGLTDQAAFTEFEFGSDQYFLLESEPRHQLALVTDTEPPKTKADAVAFAISLKNTRQKDQNSPLHDAIYIEKLSLLFPSWTVSEKIDDDQVLGSWLAGGVSVSTSSLRRISALVKSLDQNELKDVILQAGLEAVSKSGSVSEKIEGSQSPYLGSQSADQHPQKAKEKQKNIGTSLKADFKLHGRQFLEDFFNDHVVDIIHNEQRYSSLGVSFPSAVVLHGPPGCGKTFAVEKLVEFLDWPAYSIDASSVASPYIHETSRKVSEIFELAMENAPSVIVIDEMEAFLPDRQLAQSSGLHHVEEVAEFLRRIPEAMAKRVLVIGMTNRLEMIDPAILRRGRFDHVIQVGMPSEEEVIELLTLLINKMPVKGNLSIETISSKLTGRPLSDVTFAVREAGRLAAKDEKNYLDQTYLEAAIAKLPKALDEETSNPIGFSLK